MRDASERRRLPVWLWVVPPLALVGGAFALLPPSHSGSARDQSPIPPGENGVYVVAADIYGPVHAAVLVIDGNEGKWWRDVSARSREPDSALDYGRGVQVFVRWKGKHYPMRGIDPMWIEVEQDADNRLLATVRSLGRGERASETFILKKTALSDRPATLQDLLQAYGPPLKN